MIWQVGRLRGLGVWDTDMTVSVGARSVLELWAGWYTIGSGEKWPAEWWACEG
jgi:hypothetical protein